MVTSAFEGSSSEQLADLGLQLGFGNDLMLLCACQALSKKAGKLKPTILDGVKYKAGTTHPHSFHAKAVVEVLEQAGWQCPKTSRSR